MGVIRAGDEHTTWGTPYSFVCSVRRKHDEAELFAAVGNMSKKIYSQIVAALKDQGVTKITWERRKANIKHVEVNV